MPMKLTLIMLLTAMIKPVPVVFVSGYGSAIIDFSPLKWTCVPDIDVSEIDDLGTEYRI